MREIKFRAWDKDEKKMLERVELTKMLKQISNKYDNSLGGDAIRRHDLEWMQYTGLKDKNGKEIYEGDIVGFPTGSRAEVKFQLGGFECVFKDGTGSPAALRNRIYEVMGNIYENSDLLSLDGKVKE